MSRMNLSGLSLALLFLLSPTRITSEEHKFLDDICGHISGQRIYLEYGEIGTLEAKYLNNIIGKFIKSRTSNQNRCSVEFISCPSCIVNIRFKFLNLSRNCDRSRVFDACGCDYVWIYEPSFEQSSEQFCGRFIASNLSVLEYRSQTRKVVIEFVYNKDYEHAFILDYVAERNKISVRGSPKSSSISNESQTIATPFFPNPYPSDLTMEHLISCEKVNETCLISLVFTDFLISPSTIIDFFDWNGERIFVTTGNIFRPPVIVTSGPSLMIRFYANGATNLGFKAHYSFKFAHSNERELSPDIDCGGQVNNLGGGITMMSMVAEGLKSFDCIWLIKPPEAYLHLKTHLYVKVVSFSGFGGSTELIIRQGLTSDGPIVEALKFSLPHVLSSKEKEHVVSISQGFYIRLKGTFRPESSLGLVYAAFNYKECLAGSDFLCDNKRCISALLNCDGFDHCGDNSDEFSRSCSKDPRDRRQWSKTPHFLFPKVDGFSELATSTVIFLLCSFGLIGFIFAMVMLLYKVNIKTRHQRQIQDHIETINAILEEGAGVVEEEIIIPDDPPDYEAPPDYEEVLKTFPKTNIHRCSRCQGQRNLESTSSDVGLVVNVKKPSAGGSRSCQTTPIKIPDSPPPAYDAFSSGQKVTFRKVFDNLQIPSSRRSNCLCKNILSAGHFIYRICDQVKYFSDSELVQLSRSICFESVLHVPKSFTTDDVNSFL